MLGKIVIGINALLLFGVFISLKYWNTKIFKKIRGVKLVSRWYTIVYFGILEKIK